VVVKGSLETVMFSEQLGCEDLRPSDDGPKEPPTESNVTVDGGGILVEEHGLVWEGWIVR
jgi:hypothetical protein